MKYLRARDSARFAHNLRIEPAALPADHSAASAFGLRGALGFGCLRRRASWRLRGALCGASRLGWPAALRAGRLRRDVEPPPVRSARASSSTIASSSVIVSGVLSPGSVALTPLLADVGPVAAVLDDDRAALLRMLAEQLAGIGAEPAALARVGASSPRSA